MRLVCLAVLITVATAACGASDSEMDRIRTDAENRHFTVVSDYSDGPWGEWTAVVNVTFGTEHCPGRLIYQPDEPVILDATLRRHGGSVRAIVVDPNAEGMRTDPSLSQCYGSAG